MRKKYQEKIEAMERHITKLMTDEEIRKLIRQSHGMRPKGDYCYLQIRMEEVIRLILKHLGIELTVTPGISETPEEFKLVKKDG